jgi:hypothetical protein
MSTDQLFKLIQLARTDIYYKGKTQACVRRTIENHIYLIGYSKLEQQRIASAIIEKAIEMI